MTSPAVRIHCVIAALLLLFMAVLAGGAARRESITIDEVAHLGAGVSYLQKLDYRMNEEHPPLAKVLAAAPMVIRGVRADYSDLSWTFSTGVFRAMLGEWPWGHSVAVRWNNPQSTLRWGRTPMLLLTLVLGLVLYVFGSKLGNSWGGLLCLAVYVSTPAFLVFGPLILTDITVTLFCLLTMWTLAELWRSPNRSTLLRFGFALPALSSRNSPRDFCCLGFLPLPLASAGFRFRDSRRVGKKLASGGVCAAATSGKASCWPR